MRELIPKDEYGIFADAHDTARVDSLFVAQAFEKEHKNVVREIERLTASDSGLSQEFNALNFERITYREFQRKKAESVWHDKRWLCASCYGFHWSKGFEI